MNNLNQKLMIKSKLLDYFKKLTRIKNSIYVFFQKKSYFQNVLNIVLSKITVYPLS